jgi:NAD(P)-dependent dehydrogenase (short-subunit alcohol dehydrogenase family)
MKLAGNAFLVTGGSSGLGAACVRRFLGAGGKVVIADLNRQAGQSLAGELGENVRYVETDVADTANVAAAIEVAEEQFGGLHGVVNCAGILGASRLLGREGPHDLSLFSRVIEVNLIGTFNVMRLAAQMMSEAAADDEGERGVIINTSSVAAFEGQIGQTAYSASKGGVAALTLPAARELARFGIRVAAIAPGIFATPMMDGMPEQVRQSLEAQTLFPHRLGNPDEFAALAQHIIENRMLNGCVLRLDGAMRMGAK